MAEVKEVINEFCSQTGGALTALLGGDVTLTPADIKESTADEVKAAITGKVLLTSLEVTGDISGTVLVLIPEVGAAKAAILLTGEDKVPEELSELHLTALSEVGSQMADGLKSALAPLSGSITTLATEPQVIDAGTVDGEAPLAFAEGDPTLVTGNLTTGSDKGDFWLVVSKGMVEGIEKAEGFAEGVPASVPGDSDDAPVVQPAGLESVSGKVDKGEVTNLDLLRDVSLQVTVELGRTSKNIREILSFSPGSIIGLDKLEGEPVDIFVNDMLFAKGEVVVIDESFGVRIAEIISPKERLNQLQALTR